MNMYTLRHNLGMQVEYVVWADSEAEAREIAYRMYVEDEPADDVLVT